MTPSNTKAKYFQRLEPVLLGLVFYICEVIAHYTSNPDGGILSKIVFPSSYTILFFNNIFITFFFSIISFNLIFLKFKRKLLSVFLVSFFDLFLFFHLALFYFTRWGRWEWTYSLGIFNIFILSISFCVCRVIFIKILPLERSKDFIKLYHISFIILLFLFLI